jgi:hypothetical protein
MRERFVPTGSSLWHAVGDAGWKNVVAWDVEQVGSRIVDGFKAPDAVDVNAPPGCCGPSRGLPFSERIVQVHQCCVGGGGPAQSQC